MSELALKLIAENKISRATFLDLSNCGLTEIPDEIGDLTWLEGLSFTDMWWNDKTFCNSGNTGTANNLVKINNVLSQLKKLKELWLDGKYSKKSVLNDLSPLADLYDLQKLNVCDTQVTDLSPLAGLHNLQELRVIRTPVTNLSPLTGLHNLKHLNIYDTQVKDLSPLVVLNNLQELIIGGTYITNIKPLTDLYNLRRIYVMDAPITDLSPLLHLIENNLEVNWISAGDDSQEDGIYIRDCPLTNPPVEIAQQGNAAILNYFKEKESQGVDHLYEAKLLLVGAGGAGKSSLLRRLYQPELKDLLEESQTTKGIAIHRHEFKMKDSRYPEGRVFRLNVWDFGGQEKYRPTDTFFFTQRSLYVLLDDTRNDDRTVHDASFKYWLEAVDLLSDNSPVLIFQNEKGGRSKQIDLAGIKGKFDNVKHCYSGNLEYANAADALRREIETCALNLPHIGEELPKQWLAIRAAIEKQAEQHATISQEKYFSLYKKHLPFDRAKALHLSHYLHDLGVFLHFQDDDLLSRTVILQNQWATEAVFKMLDDEQVKACLGRFTNTDCVRLWQDSVYADMHPELLALMQKFELCYLLPDTTPKKWLAPQLLPPSKPLEIIDWAKSGDLVLRFRYEFLPKGLISRLMVRLHRFVPMPELAWLTGVLFERNDAQVLVEIPPKGGEIMLRARGFEHKELLSVIAADLDALNATFKGLPEKVTKLIPCDCEMCRQQIEPESFEQPDLLRRRKMGKTTIECRTSFENVLVSRLLDGVQVNKMPDWGKEENLKKETIKECQMKIFISYSKHDNEHKDTLIAHLAPLRDNDKIITWHDLNIKAGEEWDERIKEELNNADIVLYLVSAHSLATAYIQKVELPLIEERCSAKQCKLVPVIVDFCDWEESWVAKYNALPAKGSPITDVPKSWVNKNQAWLAVVKGIKQIVVPT